MIQLSKNLYTILIAVILMAIILIAVALPSPAQSPSVSGMVTGIYGDTVKINLGLDKQINPGTEFYVYRMSKPVGVIKINQVDLFTSLAEVTSRQPGLQIAVGDVVSDRPFAATTTTGTAAGSGGQTGTTGSAAAGSAAGSSGTAAPATGAAADPQAQQKKSTEDFTRMLVQYTRSYSFSGGGKGEVKVDVFDLANLLTTTYMVSGGSFNYFNSWYFLDEAIRHYNTYAYSRGQSKGAGSSIDVTWWNSKILDAYVNYVSYKETFIEDSQREEIRQNLYQQMDPNQYITFRVAIRNRGPGALQLSPFKWHIYLLDAGGARIKCDHYDEALDRALNPNTETEGFVYFPRLNDLGKPVIGPDQKTLSVVLEDIVSERRTLEWRL